MSLSPIATALAEAEFFYGEPGPDLADAEMAQYNEIREARAATIERLVYHAEYSTPAYFERMQEAFNQSRLYYTASVEHLKSQSRASSRVSNPSR